MKKVYAYTDGGSRGNPGPSGIGVYVTDDTEDVLAAEAVFIGHTTNNVAEYRAVLHAIRTLKKLFPKSYTTLHIEIRMDSELVQRQLDGVYKVKQPHLRVLYEDIVRETRDMTQLHYVHVRREYNTHADALANEAMDRGR